MYPTGERRQLDVLGVRIAYRVWGRPAAETVVLVPGAGAHGGWWQELARRLEDDLRLVAVDLSGCGDSDHRPEGYEVGVWAAELNALIEHEADGRAPVIGHSNGGRVAVIAACRYPGAFDGVLMIDSPTRRPTADGRDLGSRFEPGPPRLHSSQEQAVASFRLQPHEAVENRELLLTVATESFRQGEGGWSLKADPRGYQVVEERDLAACLEATDVPAVLVYGDQSVVVRPADVEFFLEAHPGPHEAVPIVGGRHHLLFDHGERLEILIREFVAGRPSG